MRGNCNINIITLIYEIEEDGEAMYVSIIFDTNNNLFETFIYWVE
jgi:ribosomal protein S6